MLPLQEGVLPTSRGHPQAWAHWSLLLLKLSCYLSTGGQVSVGPTFVPVNVGLWSVAAEVPAHLPSWMKGCREGTVFTFLGAQWSYPGAWIPRE
jgi:hypothetical protein